MKLHFSLLLRSIARYFTLLDSKIFLQLNVCLHALKVGTLLRMDIVDIILFLLVLQYLFVYFCCTLDY